MPKYIDADALKCAFTEGHGPSDWLYWQYSGKWIVDLIEAYPAADVEPVRHGYFIGTEFDGYADGNPVFYEWECSECGCVFEDDEPKYRFCPNCGAKMDGKPSKEED